MNTRMSMRTECLRWILAGLAMVAWSATSTAKATPQGRSLITGVEVVAELDKTELVVGEPLFLKIRVANRNAPLVIGNFISALHFAEGGDVEVHVQPPGELSYRYEAHEQPAVFATVEIGNKKDAFTHFELPMIYERKSPTGYLFDKPGQYIVSVKIWHSIMRDTTRTFTEIPPVAITVRMPAGKDLEALRLIEGPKYALALQQQVSDDTQIVERFAEVARRYPDSPYAPMCAYVAGSSMIVDPKRLEGGVAILRDYTRRYREHPMWGNAVYGIFYGYHMAGNFDRAREWFYYLMDADPGHRLMREENKLAAYYYFGRLEEVQGRRWWLYNEPWILPVQLPASHGGAAEVRP